MNNEIEALNRNNTWTIIDLPTGRKPIGCKWLFKIIYKALGEIDRYKARLVAKGFSQREGIDFDETFSLVVKLVTIRCLMCIDMSNDWPLYELDINNEFLHADLSEEIAVTLVFHEKNKHFEIDVHVVREKVQSGIIRTESIASAYQTANFFTKAHGTAQHRKLCSQLSLLDMFRK
ncbi:putative RNA-directed DNA polymerase [Tanacetum coccineum]